MLPDVSRRATSAEFIGRREDLDQIERALTATRTGEPTHILVGGEAGLGKSRLTREVMRRATESGWRVLEGGCLDIGEGGAPFAPYTELLRGWLRAVGRAEALAFAGVQAADLARLLPELQPRDAAPTQERWAHARIHNALFELCSRLSARGPLLVVLEDLHWADADTLGATQALLRAFEREPVAFLATYRTDDLHRRHPLVPWLAELTRAVRPVRLELAPFGAADVRALVTGVLGTDPGEEVVASIHRRSDGNPFFAEELLAAGSAGGSATLPSSLRELLTVRMNALTDSARRLLGLMAVVGRPVDDEALSGLGDLAPGDLREALREVIEASLVTPSGDDDGYSFRHALVQEAAYEELLPGERRALHRAIAERIEAQPPGVSSSTGHAADLARHWRACRDHPRALASSVLAGHQAFDAYAFAQAAAEYDHALSLWDQVADPATTAGLDRIELLRQTARAVHLVSEDRRAIELLEEAVDLARNGSDRLRTGSLLEQLGRVSWTAGDTHAAIRHSEEALAVMPEDPPSAERARALGGLGQVHMLNGSMQLAGRLCEEAVTVARAAGARDAEGHALNTLGTTLANLGSSEAGVAALEAALAIADEVHNADDIGRAYVNLADALWYSGQPRRALQRIQEGIEVAERLGIGAVYGFYIRMTGVMPAFDVGEWPTALRLFSEANGRLIDTQGVDRYRLAYGTWPLVATGAPEGKAMWARAWALVPHDPAVSTTGSTPHFAGVELAIWEGRPRDGITIATDGFDRIAGAPTSPFQLRLARLGARAAADLVELEGAPAVAEARSAAARYEVRARAAFAGMAEPGPGLVARSTLELRTIAAERSRLEGASDAAMWAGLRDDWAAIEAVYESSYCGVRSAVASLASDDAEQGTRSLGVALAGAHSLGAAPMASWISRVARRYGLRPEKMDQQRDGAAGRSKRPAATDADTSLWTVRARAGGAGAARLGPHQSPDRA